MTENEHEVNEDGDDTHKTYIYPESGPEMPGDSGPFTGRKRHHPVISFERRVQLNALARHLAEIVLPRTKAHERCLLRSMVEALLPEE